MSTKKILRWALDAETGTVSEKVLLLTLAIHADGEGLVSPGPSWSTLRRQTRLSRSTIHAALRGLEDCGLIVRANRCRANGSHSSCEYLLSTDLNEATRPVQPSDGYPSDERTGTRPMNGPVQPSDGSTRPAIGPVPTSTNVESYVLPPVTGPMTGPPRPAIGPLEVKEKELKELAAARYARDAHTRAREAPTNGTRVRRNGRGQLDRLAATAVSKDAYVLVAEWRVNHATPLPQDFYDQVAKAVQGLLDDPDLNAEPALIRQALTKMDRRPEAGLGLLRGFYTDMVRTRNDRLSRPAFDEYGRPQRPLCDISDEDLTPHTIELIIGADSWTIPAPPPEQDPNDIDAHLAWCRQAAAEHLADRRRQARAALDHRAARNST